MNESLLHLFGLTENQTRIMYSMQYQIVEEDIKNSPTKVAPKKIEWVNEWLNKVSPLVGQSGNDWVYSRSNLVDEICKENSNKNGKIWYSLIIIECITFVPFFPLDANDGKKYAHLKFKNQLDFIKKMVKEQKIRSAEDVERFSKVYNKSLNRIAGKLQKTLLPIVSVLAVSAIAALAAFAFAPAIAVAIYGSQFAGLHGIALTNACLAMIGGGAIAVGGAGVAGGTLVVAGGGAVLGLTVSTAGAIGINSLFSSSPKFTLTQAAKLEVVMREILLNEQHDTIMVQEVLKRQSEQIGEMGKELAQLKLNEKQNKEKIKNLEKSIEYLTKAYSEMEKFNSSFEEGLKAENK